MASTYELSLCQFHTVEKRTSTHAQPLSRMAGPDAPNFRECRPIHIDAEHPRRGLSFKTVNYLRHSCVTLTKLFETVPACGMVARGG